MPKYKFERTEISSEEEIKGMVKATKDEWLKAIIVFLYLFGCRITEAINLKKRSVWLEDGYVVAQIGVLKRRKEKKGPYGMLPHQIHVSIEAPFVKDVLMPYLEQINDKEASLFPYSRQTVWRKMKALNGIISPHVFRHDRLMKLALKKATESELMDWAGWTDSRPASNYIRATGRLAFNLADKIE